MDIATEAELALVRSRLDELVQYRFLGPLGLVLEWEYRELASRELELLEQKAPPPYKPLGTDAGSGP